jgi:hypothetical protein
MVNCWSCGEELLKHSYRDLYDNVRECKCGALNSICPDKTNEGDE